MSAVGLIKFNLFFEFLTKTKSIFNFAPRVIVTDKLRSYIGPIEHLCPKTEHSTHKCLNNLAENPHQPTQKREIVDKIQVFSNGTK